MSDPAADTVGAVETVPDPVDSLTVVAPELVQAIFPLAPFEAEEVNLTYTFDDATVPLEGVKEILEPKLEPEVFETSYPVGAVTVISPDKLAPEMVKFCSVPAEPWQEANVEKEALVDIVGEDVIATASELWHPLLSVTVKV